MEDVIRSVLPLPLVETAAVYLATPSTLTAGPAKVISHPLICDYWGDEIEHVLVFPDINECSTANGGCDQECENTPGSYQCLCQDGYLLHIDGTTCTGKL